MILDELNIVLGRVKFKDFNLVDERIVEVFKDLGMDLSKYSILQLIKGFKVELEHGVEDPDTNVTNDDPVMTAKIAWAHLKEDSSYYDKLEKMERGFQNDAWSKETKKRDLVKQRRKKKLQESKVGRLKTSLSFVGKEVTEEMLEGKMKVNILNPLKL